MRIGLLTDGGYPYATGESRLWCDRLVRGLAQHEFDLFALSRTAEQEARGWVQLPLQVSRVRTAPLWTADEDTLGLHAPRGLLSRLLTGGGARSYGRRERRRFTTHFTALATAVCAADAAGGERDDARPDESGPDVSWPGGSGHGAYGDGGRAAAGFEDARFTGGLYGLAELACEHGGLPAALRSETALRILEAACGAPGTGRTVQAATVPDLLAFAAELDRVLRPLSLDWYDEESLGAVDLCHATSGGAAALPGLLAKRFFGVPLLVTEHSVQLRSHYLAAAGTPVSAPVRALLANFHGRLAGEVYRQAALITPGNAHARRWQERCGAEPAKVRTVYPGMESGRFAALGENEGDGGPDTLVWVGRIEPAKDLVALLHAFAEVRRAEPDARLRIIGAAAQGPEGATYLAHCRALAAQLFPDEAADTHAADAHIVDAHAADAHIADARAADSRAADVHIADSRSADSRAAGDHPVSFEDIGGAGIPDLAQAYAAGGIVVLSSVAEGFPISLVEAMFCGRATVSTDVGAVVEVIGGTGLVVPPRNPRALADACLALLRDPKRRARLGAAARARALELFTVEQNLAAFRGIYLELIARAPVRRDTAAANADGGPRPFATPPEAHVLGLWPESDEGPDPGPAERAPSWAGHGICAGARGAGDRDA
ncbi:glycosyltransferase [Streptomyces brevispora]|uniref:glycosyltransferase n=1 Tax=Streptomyces brevispora TaxID=887462 RepID=UPI0011A6733A|nr:glycosyltransferase [Streptomyces brevispora]